MPRPSLRHMAVLALALTVSVRLLTGSEPAAPPAPPTPDLDSADEIASQVGQARFERASAQKEALDFLWVPGELIRQQMEGKGPVVYPHE